MERARSARARESAKTAQTVAVAEERVSAGTLLFITMGVGMSNATMGRITFWEFVALACVGGLLVLAGNIALEVMS